MAHSTSLLLLTACAVAIGLPASLAEHVTVSTGFGRIVGSKLRMKDGSPVFKFQGVPYAEPLSNKFEQSVKVTGWHGTVKALKLKPSCLFSPQTYKDEYWAQSDYNVSTDCLYLNIYTPSLPNDPLKLTSTDKLLHGEAPFPVAIYFPNDVIGQEFEPLELVTHQKIVLVVVNYRVGPFGYACEKGLASRALQDQRLSMEWVQTAIHSFYGDPDRVTILANGRAAVDASVHLLTSGDAPFSGVWLSSGSSLELPQNYGRHSIASRTFLKAMDCSSLTSFSLEKCLNDLSTHDITRWYDGYRKKNEFQPCVDGDVLQSSPLAMYRQGKWRTDTNLIIGFPMLDVCEGFSAALTLETMEGIVAERLSEHGISRGQQAVILEQIPGLYEFMEDFKPLNIVLCEILTDIHIASKAIALADHHSGRIHINKRDSLRGKVYMYEFTHKLSIKDNPMFVDTTRGDDLLSLLGVPCSDWWPISSSPEDCEMSKEIMFRLGNFLRTGNPDSHTSIHMWPEYYSGSTEDTDLMAIRNPFFSTIVTNYRSNVVGFWAKHLFSDATTVHNKPNIVQSNRSNAEDPIINENASQGKGGSPKDEL